MATTTFTPSMLRGAGTRGIPEIPAGSSFPNLYSMAFDGVDERIDPDFTTGTNNVSISCWMKSSESVLYNESRIAFGARPTTGGSNYSIGRIRSQYATPTELNVAVFNTFGTTVLNDGNWHNLVYTLDFTTKEIKAYVDGNTTPVFTYTSNRASDASTAALKWGIGWGGSFYAYDGLIDVGAIWESILTASQITNIYRGETDGGSGGTNGIPGDLSTFNPVGWWRMGDNDSGTGTTITDQGSGSNDGTLTNGPTFSTDVPT